MKKIVLILVVLLGVFLQGCGKEKDMYSAKVRSMTFSRPEQVGDVWDPEIWGRDLESTYEEYAKSYLIGMDFMYINRKSIRLGPYLMTIPSVVIKDQTILLPEWDEARAGYLVRGTGIKPSVAPEITWSSTKDSTGIVTVYAKTHNGEVSVPIKVLANGDISFKLSEVSIKFNGKPANKMDIEYMLMYNDVAIANSPAAIQQQAKEFIEVSKYKNSSKEDNSDIVSSSTRDTNTKVAPVKSIKPSTEYNESAKDVIDVNSMYVTDGHESFMMSDIIDKILIGSHFIVNNIEEYEVKLENYSPVFYVGEHILSEALQNLSTTSVQFSGNVMADLKGISDLSDIPAKKIKVIRGGKDGLIIKAIVESGNIVVELSPSRYNDNTYVVNVEEIGIKDKTDLGISIDIEKALASFWYNEIMLGRK